MIKPLKLYNFEFYIKLYRPRVLNFFLIMDLFQVKKLTTDSHHPPP